MFCGILEWAIFHFVLCEAVGLPLLKIVGQVHYVLCDIKYRKEEDKRRKKDRKKQMVKMIMKDVS
jgi:hypothetical protein